MVVFGVDVLVCFVLVRSICIFYSLAGQKNYTSQVRSQPVFSGKPEGPFCLSCAFIFRNERNWMKKSARVSEKTGKPGLTWLPGSYGPVSEFKSVCSSRLQALLNSYRDRLQANIPS